VAWSIFVVLFIWQFPHFMAIAWMYREQYADGRLRMLTVVDPTGRRAARKSLGWASLLLPASWLGALAMESQAATVVYLFAATVVAIFYLQAAIRFYREINDGNARKLLRASLVYLPIQLLLVVAGCVLPFSR
jgi:protoheme IX farnesyltransferase